MTELVHFSHRSCEDSRTETDISDRWLYQLWCIFFASASLGSDPYNYEFNHDLRLRFQETEATTLLISIAASIRRRIERSSERDRSEIEKRAPQYVGTLVSHTNGSPKDMPLRSACNKILHATTFAFDYDDSACRPGGIIKPVIHLYGDLRDSKWKASIDIPAFVSAAWHQG